MLIIWSSFEMYPNFKLQQSFASYTSSKWAILPIGVGFFLSEFFSRMSHELHITAALLCRHVFGCKTREAVNEWPVCLWGTIKCCNFNTIKARGYPILGIVKKTFTAVSFWLNRCMPRYNLLVSNKQRVLLRKFEQKFQQALPRLNLHANSGKHTEN